MNLKIYHVTTANFMRQTDSPFKFSTLASTNVHKHRAIIRPLRKEEKAIKIYSGQQCKNFTSYTEDLLNNDPFYLLKALAQKICNVTR